MIEKINHYSITHAPSVYDEEAMTALELAGRTAGKMNELIDDHYAIREEVNHFTRQGAYDIVEDKVEEHILSGDFDRAIANHAGELEARLDNLIGTVPEGSTTMDAEVIDARVRYDNVAEDNAGAAIRSQLVTMGEAVSNAHRKAVVFKEFVMSSYYSTVTGEIINEPSFIRSKYLVPCGEGILFTSADHEAGDGMFIICYDRDKKYLGYCPVNSTNAPHPGASLRVTYPDTAFIGLTIKVPLIPEFFTVTLTPVSAPVDNFIEWPFSKSGKEYIYAENYWINGNGDIAATTNYDCVMFPAGNIKEVYTNATMAYNFFCVSADNVLLSTGSEYEGENLGRRYTVPEGTALIGMNVQKAMAKKGAGDVTVEVLNYITFTREEAADLPLNGKVIWCIGDSITWLDGQYNVDNCTHFTGYQRELRKRGARVYSFGYSGGVVAKHDANSVVIGTNFASESKSGIPSPDLVLYFGGTNDIYYGNTPEQFDTALGTVPLSLYNAITGTWDAETNPDIYFCEILPSDSPERTPETVEAFNEVIRKNGRYFQMSVIPLNNLSGLTAKYRYDNVHPNLAGMKKLGAIIGKYIESTI